MSTVTKKLQRYAVTYKGRLIFKNAVSGDEALARVRTDLMMEAVRVREAWIAQYGRLPIPLDTARPTVLSVAPEPDTSLASLDLFKAAAAAKVSLRY